MIKKYSTESDTSYKTVEKWVYPQQKSSPKNGPTDKLLRKHTKPDTKTQLNEFVSEMQSGNVSDDHVKQVGDALADAFSASHKIKNPKVWFIQTDIRN